MTFVIGHLPYFVLLAAIALFPRTAAKPALRRVQSCANQCRIVRTFAQVSNGVEATWRCIRYNDGEEGTSFVIDLDTKFTKAREDDLLSGTTYVQLTNATFNPDIGGVAKVNYTKITVVPSSSCGSNRQISTEGTKKVLVIRAYVKGTKGTISAKVLRDSIFDANSTSLSSQLSQCSASQLVLDEASGSSIKGGVLDVPIDITKAKIGKLGRTVVENKVAVAARALVKTSLDNFDHVIFCLPETSGDWKSEGYLNWHRSLFNVHVCNDINHLMHEIGMNLGLNREDKASGTFGMMGPSVKGKPSMCYDQANSWKLGWYKEASEDIDPFGDTWEGWGGQIVGIADFERENSDESYTVLAKISSGSEASDKDLYLGFNRNIGINEDTQGYKNEIVLAKRKTIKSSGISEVVVETVASMSIKGINDDTIEVTNFGRPDRTLLIQLCDIRLMSGSKLSYARVVINLSDPAGTKINYFSCYDLQEGEGFAVSSFQSGTSGIPSAWYVGCKDYASEFTYGGMSYTCRELEGATKLYPKEREMKCTTSNAGLMCRDLCSPWLDCEKSGNGGSATTIKTSSSSSAVSPLIPKKTGNGSTDVRETEIGVQQASGIGAPPAAGGPCADAPGVIFGLDKTCAQLASSIGRTKLRRYCRREFDVRKQCRHTCSRWIPCRN